MHWKKEGNYRRKRKIEGIERVKIIKNGDIEGKYV